MADRIGVLAAGRVLQTGTPREVYLRPSTPAVARALGSPPMNELPVRRANGHWIAEADGTVLCPAPLEGPERALLGVRAEHVAPEGGAGAAVVEVVEDAGPHRVVVARFAGARVHLFAPRSLDVRPGDTIHPRVSAAHVVEWSLP
jgi:ABC-type sugar transport system ATPase subunit